MKIDENKIKDLYLDLMKKALTFMLWPEPGLPMEIYNKRPVLAFISRILAKTVHVRLTTLPPQEQRRIEGRLWPALAHTMIGLKRLDNIQFCVESILKDNIPGDFIETGAWRGGACIFMKAVLATYGIKDRRVFVADSFGGLPPPNEELYEADRGDKHHSFHHLVVSKEEVEENFRKYGLLDDRVIFLAGWFKDTLPNAPIERLSLLRLDGDMYESTIEALQSLYHKLSVGGYCIIDDYNLKGCRQAVHDFLEQNHLKCEIKKIDRIGVYWRKEKG